PSRSRRRHWSKTLGPDADGEPGRFSSSGSSQRHVSALYIGAPRNVGALYSLNQCLRNSFSCVQLGEDKFYFSALSGDKDELVFIVRAEGELPLPALRHRLLVAVDFDVQ